VSRDRRLQASTNSILKIESVGLLTLERRCIVNISVGNTIQKVERLNNINLQRIFRSCVVSLVVTRMDASNLA
jgi:hypothetical protein